MSDVDIRKAIQAKSDQLNADDLIGGSMTVTIENVTEGNSQNPVAIYYTGCNGKPWYPAKTVLRALVAAWTDVGKDWIGKSLTIFRDPEVEYAGVKVGGIRVSHLSHIDADFILMLSEKRGKKKKFSFKKLIVKQDAHNQDALNIDEQLASASKALRGAKSSDALEKMVSHARFAELRSALGDRASELDAVVSEVRARYETAPVTDSDDF